jgi:glycosyl transferase family 87
MSRSARAILAIVFVVAAVQGVSLVTRGARGYTDVSVFYRTCVLLGGGAGGEIYTRHDTVTDWPISLTPAGLAFFQPLVLFGPLGASIGWAIVNLGVLGVSILVLRRFLKSAYGPRSDVLFPWATLLFVVLAAASIQVGQFSVLFAGSWILFVSAFAAGNYASAGMLLALPTAIKLYPVMMLAVPISLARSARAGLRTLFGFMLGLVIFSAIVPFVVYGSRARDLNASFWQNVIRSPTGQVAYMQTVRASNQSIDALLLRYLTFDVEFHPEEPVMPHLDLPKQRVLPYADLARLIILAMTVVTVCRWRSRHPTFRPRDVLTMSALWSCTLYLMLPETKARYAVYTFIAFLPLLEVAVNENEQAAVRLRAFVEIAFCAILIGGLLPDPPKVYGIGLIGAVVLWLRNLGLVRVEAGSGLVAPGLAKA